MRALITGGAGFIGSHLAEHLLAQGAEVVILDDLSTGSLDNVSHLIERPGFAYHIDTIMNRPVVAALVDECDVVFHMAAAVGVQLIIDHPVRTISTNVEGTEIVLQSAAQRDRLVVIASTSEVYGKRAHVPFREDDDLILGPPHRRRWSYACSKAIDEFLAMAYWEQREVPIIIARLFNTIGPRQTGQYGMVVPRFIDQALGGQPIRVFGDGSQSRCFADVTDVVRILVALSRTTSAVGQIVNVGNDDEVSITDLAARIKRVTQSVSPIVRVPYDEAYPSGFEDMQRRVPDLAKLERLINDRPRTSLEETLTRIVAARARQGPRTDSPVSSPTVNDGAP